MSQNINGAIVRDSNHFIIIVHLPNFVGSASTYLSRDTVRSKYALDLLSVRTRIFLASQANLLILPVSSLAYFFFVHHHPNIHTSFVWLPWCSYLSSKYTFCSIF